MIPVLAGVAAGLAGIGLAQSLIASRLVAAFAGKAGIPLDLTMPALQKAAITPHIVPTLARPPVTVLKPLHGAEPLLLEALTTLCQQDYPTWQIVFGVQDAADPALTVVRHLRDQFPDMDIAIVVDPTIHGANRKVGNLINMLPAARHDILVIADSDVHVRPDYLDRLSAALQQPGVGLVTTLYAGLPAEPATLPARLGATQITHAFLPGAVLARAIGRQDCLGATMALRRRDLDAIGGFRTLVHHLADDNVLGRRIAGLGLHIALADTVPLTTVPEDTLRALFQHELRWARTIRALEPVGFAASVLQFPLAWALLTILLAGGALWSIGLFFITWVVRAIAACWVDAALAPLWTNQRDTSVPDGNALAPLAFCCPVWLLPLRDILSIAVMLTSYGGRRVSWRGHGLRADTPPPVHQAATLRPIEGANLR